MSAATDIHLLAPRDDRERFERTGVQVVQELTESAAEEIKNLFVLVSGLQLPEVATVVKAANRKKHLRGLFVEQPRDPNWVPAMLDRADLRTLRNTVVHADPSVFERILNAWRLGAQNELIADATVQGDILFVRTCALDTIEMELSDLESLQGAGSDELVELEVSTDGAYIRWPELDVDIDLETIRVVRDPELREEFQKRRLDDEQRMGRAIRALRIEDELRQRDIEGISTRQVRRIEKGEVRPRTDTLRHFAKAHGLSLNEYLNRLAEAM